MILSELEGARVWSGLYRFGGRGDASIWRSFY